jgi:hypothetical protein
MKQIPKVMVCFSAVLMLFPLITAAQQPQAEDNWQQQEAGVSQMAHGGVGLIQTPTARMLPEGSMTASYTDNDEYRFWSVSVQLFDWLESTIRYSDIRTQLYSFDPGFSGDQTLKDKGIDVKLRLWQESQFIPQISTGFRDFGGTGLFESEYITLSKKWHDIDFHLGIGWGYLGRAGTISNPFCQLADSFCQRTGETLGQGGKISYNKFFRGPASLFGGIEYQTPWQPLQLKLEYEGNDYLSDRAGPLRQESRWNIGAVYHWGDASFDLNYQRGNTLGFGVHYTFDLHERDTVSIKPAKMPLAMPRPEQPLFTDPNVLPRTLLANAGFLMQSSRIDGDEFVLFGTQLHYRDDVEATERVTRVALSLLPAYIKRVRIIEYGGNLPLVEKQVNADDFVRAATYNELQPDIRSTYVRRAPDAATVALNTAYTAKGVYTGLETFWVQSFGNPEAFYLYQGGVFFGAGYRFSDDISFNSTAKLTVLENFDKFNYKVDALESSLPRVRTQVREYVTRSRLSMENTYLHWQTRLDTNWFAQAYGGYLEMMYGGVGTELLYRPVDSDFAFGVDINYVRQRSYENDFAFFDYKTLTGHANLYWHPSLLPDSRLTFNIGQFLAKDKGVNIDFAKRFDSGMILGAFAAITNVSSDEYGEGSFTKGFYLSIPFDIFAVRPAKGRGRLPWIPIARDGGQPLNRPVKLIDSTEARSGFFD